MKKRTRQVLRHFPELVVDHTEAGHIRITDPITGDFTITSGTPGRNCRYEKNFRSSLRKLRRGCGFMSLARMKRGF